MFIAALIVAAAIGGCGGGNGDTSADPKPAKTHIGGGKINTDRLEESVPERGATHRPGQ